MIFYQNIVNQHKYCQIQREYTRNIWNKL